MAIQELIEENEKEFLYFKTPFQKVQFLNAGKIVWPLWGKEEVARIYFAWLFCSTK